MTPISAAYRVLADDLGERINKIALIMAFTGYSSPQGIATINRLEREYQHYTDLAQALNGIE